jgi:hypothetical protein
MSTPMTANYWGEKRVTSFEGVARTSIRVLLQMFAI